MSDSSKEPPPGLIIRTARLEDIPRLKALYRQLIPDENPSEEHMARTLRGIIQNPTTSTIVVAELDGKAVATCQMVVYDNLIRTPHKKSIIDSVVVDEPYRNRDIGTAMIRWALGEFRRRGCMMSSVSSAFIREIAPKLYAKVGFQKFGTTFSMKFADKK